MHAVCSVCTAKWHQFGLPPTSIQKDINNLSWLCFYNLESHTLGLLFLIFHFWSSGGVQNVLLAFIHHSKTKNLSVQVLRSTFCPCTSNIYDSFIFIDCRYLQCDIKLNPRPLLVLNYPPLGEKTLGIDCTVNIYDKMVLFIMDIYSVTKSSTPSLVLPTQLPSMKLGDKTMMVLEIDEYCCPGPF